MANSFRIENYRSSRPLSFVVLLLLGVQIGCYGLYLLLSVVQIVKPDMTLDAESPDLTIPLVAIGLLSFVETLARRGTVVMFLIWLYRAYSNLSPLKARGLEFSPGWAVGWWFIPFANLIKPYQAVAETWRESDPDYDPDLGYLTSSVENPWVFPIWWGAWIVGNVLSRLAEKLVDDTHISDGFMPIFILASIFTGIGAAAAFWIVRETTARQDARWARLGAERMSLEPPPPPTFGVAEHEAYGTV